MIDFLKKYLFWFKVAGIAAAAGGLLWIGGHFGALPAERELADLKAQHLTEKVAADQVVIKALQKQIVDKAATEANNARIIDVLHSQVDSLGDARDYAVRLRLAAESSADASRRELSETQRELGALAAGETDRAERARQLCADLREEARWNADHYDALIGQLKPQL